MPELNYKLILMGLEARQEKLWDQVNTYSKAGNQAAVQIFRDSIKLNEEQLSLVREIVKEEGVA